MVEEEIMEWKCVILEWGHASKETCESRTFETV
jgi:hypothetical protein